MSARVLTLKIRACVLCKRSVCGKKETKWAPPISNMKEKEAINNMATERWKNKFLSAEVKRFLEIVVAVTADITVRCKAG